MGVVEFVFGTTSNEDSEFETGNKESLMCVGQNEKGVGNPQGEKPGYRVKETRGSIRKVLYGCKRPEEISRISVRV